MEDKNLSSEILFDAFPKQIEFIEDCLSNQYKFVGYFGSIRGGKTFALLGLFIMLCRMFPNSRWVVCRKDLERIKTTVFPTFYSIYPQTFTKALPTQHNQWVWEATNGSVIKFFAENIDKDPELKRFRGLEYDGIGFEEMDISKKTFAKGFERSGTWRMRWRKQQMKNGLKVPPAIVIGTSNPQSGWVKDDLYDKSIEGKLNPLWKIIISKIYDNPHVTEEYIQSLKDSLSYLDFMKYVEGDWSVNENDKPFFHSFNSDIHIGQTEIVRHEPLYISFDFNIHPTTAVIGQKIMGVPLMVHDVVMIDGGTERLCNELEWTLSHPGGLIVTGDFSGNTGNTAAGMLEGGVFNTDFNIIKEKLRLTDYDFINTRKANPRHEYSRRLCNYIFEKSKITINSKCKPLIHDLQIAQALDNGKLRKDREGFKMDACDAFRYLCNAWFTNGFADIQEFNEILL